MIRRTALACTALAALTSPVRAQLVTFDPTQAFNALQGLMNDSAAAAQRLAQINNQIAQLVQLKATLAAVAHGNVAAVADLVPQLGAMGITNPFGDDASGMMQSLSGLAESAGQLAGVAGQTGQLAQSLLNTDQFYAASGGDFRAASLLQAARAVSYQKALAQRALDATAKRIEALGELRERLGTTSTLKGSTDAVARMVGEVAMGQATTNQLLAFQAMQRAQELTDEQRELQAWRCSAEALVASAQGGAAAAAGGTVQLVSAGSGGSARCDVAAPANATPPVYVASNAVGTLSRPPATSLPDDGTTLARMTGQSWGQQAANNATALGVNPVALAATCSLESNCRTNVGGAGTISGTFQMSDGTYAETIRNAVAANPGLASQVSTKNDPATQSIAASQYLKQGASMLQRAGIDNPTVLDVRGYYNFGPANAANLAAAPDNQLMSATLSFSDTVLRQNGINPGVTTVGQWRAGVVGKIGESAASQPVLLGSSPA